MTIEEAIKKATEGGWQSDKKERAKVNLFNRYAHENIFCDSKFWQSLGKGLAWKGFYRNASDSTWSLYDLRKSDDNDFVDDHWIPVWKYRWHQFIDHLAEGKTASDYFKTL